MGTTMAVQEECNTTGFAVQREQLVQALPVPAPWAAGTQGHLLQGQVELRA